MPVHYSEHSAGPSTRRSGAHEPSTDYGEWTKPELVAELESRDLPKSGNKDELIARLQEDDG